MKTQKEVLTILPDKTGGSSRVDEDNKKLFVSGLYSVTDVDGDVYLQSSVFNEVFGKTKKMSKDSVKRLAIVKIEENGKAIYRAYRASSIDGLTSKYVGLTPNSLYLLNDAEGKAPTKVELSPGKYIPFYWYHPDKAIRISFKLGLLSVALGFLSVVLGLLGFVLGICSLVVTVVSWLT